MLKGCGLILSRRNFLKYVGGSIVAFSAPSIAKISSPTEPRILLLNSINTGEKVESCYFDGVDYIPSELQRLNYICRDYRVNETCSMDKKLFDQLKYIQRLVGKEAEINIISAYRSPVTNSKLHSQSTGVAKKSYHMLGQAIDFSLTGVSLARVHQAALSMKVGGVGYYPRSGFVHIDTGPVRNWRGS